jgi:Holliday junction resolvase RusA-like endonuclease
MRKNPATRKAPAKKPRAPRKPPAPKPVPTVPDGILWSYWIPGTPRSGKNHTRPLVLGNGRRIFAKSKAAAAWQAEAINAMAHTPKPPRPLCGALKVSVEVHQSGDKPDGDNVQSAAWDALCKAGVIEDDSHISIWFGTKHTGVPVPEHGVLISVVQVA